MSCQGRRNKLPTCYQMKAGVTGGGGQDCMCAKKPESGKCADYKTLEMETEEELEKAKKMLEKTENSMRGSQMRQKSCAPARKAGKSCPSSSNVSRKPSGVTDSREAIKRLSKVEGKECECPDGKSKAGCGKEAPRKPSLACKTLDVAKPGKIELPRKPVLTNEELDELLEQEARDVESAWMLTTGGRDSYKKPCPKQQKARDAVKALVEPRKTTEEAIVPCVLTAMKELPPLVDPEPDDIFPEIAANMMYTMERGVKMISCPEETVRHLFPEQFGPPESEKKQDAEETESIKSVVEETEEGVNDAVYTRTMSKQREGEDRGSRQFGSSNKTYDAKREFMLQERAAKCVNRVQLRGNYAPWFPGYYVAFPDQAGDQTVQLAKSPSVIFQRAWQAGKPCNVPPGDLYLVE